MSTSTIPDAIDGLVALLGASTSLRGVKVFDGQPVTDTPKDFIAVGYAEEGQAVSFRQEPRGLGNQRRGETFDIACVVSAWNGSTNPKTVRDRAFALYGACETAIRNGATLGASVIFSQIVSGGVSQFQTEQGAVCDIEFTVSAESRI